MPRMYTLLLKNGRVISPAVGFPTVPSPEGTLAVHPGGGGPTSDFFPGMDGIADIALWGGMIAEVGQDLNPDFADETIDLSGKVVIPGIIDSHVHISSVFGGLEGHKMLARAGVTTAVDMAGPAQDVFRGLKSHGTGLNILSVEAMIPGRRVPSESPSRKELETSLRRAISEGSLGMKIIGEPYGLTSEATAMAFAQCAAWDCFCAIHAGTTHIPSNINGFQEIVALAGDLPLYIAHINVYCKGHIKSPAEESAIALELLASHPRIYSDSYMSPNNACSAKIVDGKPKNPFTRAALRQIGYSEDENGVRKALLNEKMSVSVVRDGERVPVYGKLAVEHWLKAETRIDAYVHVNPIESRVRLATARYKKGDRLGDFMVDSLSSDGGGLARNDIVESGLALVQLGGLSLQDFIRKTSINPAAMLGLAGKGRLCPGMDADITVLDLERRRAVYSVASGKLVLRDGMVCGTGGTAWVLAAGRKFVSELGLKVHVIDNDAFLHERT